MDGIPTYVWIGFGFHLFVFAAGFGGLLVKFKTTCAVVATGVISGVATESGEFNFVVEVADTP